MIDIVSILKNSRNKLLEAEAADLAKWSKLRHNKEDLELFLNHSIAHLKFVTLKGETAEVIGTANTALIKVMGQKTADKKAEAVKQKSTGMKTNDSLSVIIWDLEAMKPKTVSLKAWEIIDFVILSQENILLIDSLLKDVLKRR